MEQSSPTKKEVNNINIKPMLNPELLFFKNEILGDLKQLENKLLRKIDQKCDSSQKKVAQIETSIDNLTKKLFNISNFYSENVTMKDKIENLFQSRTSMEETLFTHEYKLSSIAKDLVTAINKYDKIFEKSIIYPGLIGASNSKFNTFHNFIDYVMANISQLNHFKEKTMGFDLKQYKNRLEATIEGFRKQTEEIITNNKVYTSKLIKNLDNKFKNDYELYDQKLFNLRIKNTEQVIGIEKLSKNLVNDLKSLNEMKKNIEKSYETSIQVLRWHYIYTENRMNQCVKDYDEIKKRIDLILEAFKGMKGGSIPNLPVILKEFENLGDNKKEQSAKIKAESLLKKYIVGEMNMEQIAQLSKKSSGKVKFNENLIKSNIFEDNINSNSSNKKNNLSRMNTRSFIKYDSSHQLNSNKDNPKSENKTNKMDIFSSQRLVFSKRFQEFSGKLSSSINLKSQKSNNSDVSDKRNIFKRMGTTFFDDKKLSKLIEQQTNLSPRGQLLNLQNNKKVLDEKISLNDNFQHKSSLLTKNQKNNAYINKEISVIKESQSEYKNELNKTENEKLETKNQENKNNNEEKNFKLSLSKENKENIIEEAKNNSSNISEKTDKNKAITKRSKSPRENQDGEKEDRISNLDNQTILSTISEHIILTPKNEDEKEQKKYEEIVNNNKDPKENPAQNKIIHNIKSAPNIKKLKEKNIKNINVIIKKEEKQKKEQETKMEKVYEDKENKTNIRSANLEYISRNEDRANIKDILFPSEKTFQGNRDNNNFYFEIENKTQENLNDKGVDIISINTGSKIGLHKLLKGDKNALNSFKLISNGEDIKIPKLPNSEYEKKSKRNRNKSINNLISTKSKTNKDLKSASSINFFKSNNNNQINNDFKLDIFENLFENNFEDFYNDLIGNNSINNLNPVLEPNNQDDYNKDKNSKLHIVHIPAVSQTQRPQQKEYSKDALNRIEALRKIKNVNNPNLSGKNRTNKSSENLKNRQQFGRLKLNNKLMRTYEGFNM